MKVFLDTANIDEIKKINELGIVDGVTTNPTIIAKEGKEFEEVIKEISKVIKGPISAEVTSMDSEGMIREAREISKWNTNIVVKIPMTEEGLKAVNILSKENIKTNVTLIFSISQGLMAIKAGASYISPFVGRLEDISFDGLKLIEDLCNIIKKYDFNTEVIAASIRNVGHVQEVAKVGCHIATIPTNLFEKMYYHPLTEKGIDQFMEDWEKFKSRD